MLVPVVLFVYNRLFLLEQTIAALKNNLGAAETDLIVFSDGPKLAGDKEKVNEVRSYVKKIIGFKTVNIIERDRNWGLANSIISGLADVFDKYNSAIILEDDVITSSYFLSFMNEGLKKYEHDDRVGSVHGYIYPVKKTLPDNFFLYYANCWGWATWKRSWALFSSDADILLEKLKQKKLQRRFDFNNSIPYTEMLEKQAKGKINSWAIRWMTSLFLENKLSLYPGESLAINIGLNEDGTHSRRGGTTYMQGQLTKKIYRVENIMVQEDIKARKLIGNFFYQLYKNQMNKNNCWNSLKRFIKRVVKRILIFLKLKKSR